MMPPTTCERCKSPNQTCCFLAQLLDCVKHSERGAVKEQIVRGVNDVAATRRVVLGEACRERADAREQSRRGGAVCAQGRLDQQSLLIDGGAHL